MVQSNYLNITLLEMLWLITSMFNRKISSQSTCFEWRELVIEMAAMFKAGVPRESKLRLLNTSHPSFTHQTLMFVKINMRKSHFVCEINVNSILKDIDWYRHCM